MQTLAVMTTNDVQFWLTHQYPTVPISVYLQSIKDLCFDVHKRWYAVFCHLAAVAEPGQAIHTHTYCKDEETKGER